MTNCLLAGVGGQGTVLASKLIAQSAMNRGLNARTAETIGMAQRGGCVVSHVRIGDEIHSPLIPQHKADLIIGFEPAEAVRCLPYLKEDGAVIASIKPVKPVTAALTGSGYSGEEMISFLKENVKNLYLVDAETICDKLGSSKVLNVVLLGAAAGAGLLELTLEELKKIICEKLPECFIELNCRALTEGAAAVRKG
jgi:indolepyruvate ferredoxin oxidoreductase beta subunit